MNTIAACIITEIFTPNSCRLKDAPKVRNANTQQNARHELSEISGLSMLTLAFIACMKWYPPPGLRHIKVINGHNLHEII